MPSLFLVYLGGKAKNSNIELHDVRFVAGDKIEDTYPALREQWFGIVKGLHVDSYLSVKFVDGYRVELREEPFEGKEKLYFINIGGYDPKSVAELHQFGIFVATSQESAKKAAKAKLLAQSVNQHKDDMFDVDDCFVVDKIQQYYVHLIADSRTQPFEPDWFGYEVIG